MDIFSVDYLIPLSDLRSQTASDRFKRMGSGMKQIG